MASLPAPHLSVTPNRCAHKTRTAALALLAMVAAITVALAPGAPAQAKPSAADVQKQISDLNNQIETVVEQYNGVHTKLAADQAKAKTLKAKLPQANLQAVLAQQRVGAIAHDVYIEGPTSGLAALLDMESTNALLDELGALNSIAKDQRTTIDTANAAVASFQTQATTLNAVIGSETAQDTQLASKKADIIAQLAKLKTLQSQIQDASTTTNGGGGGKSGGIVGSGPKTSKSYVEPVSCPQQSGSGAGRTAALKACSLVWSNAAPHIHWYGWAQAGPSRYDCSGMTMTAWAAAGVSLEHFTGGQWSETTHVSRSRLQVGDLVFYYGDHHHVAIYIGNGYIAQAQETGEPLKVSPIGSPTGYGHPHK